LFSGYNWFCDWLLAILFHFDMESVKEQRNGVTFCFKVGKTATKTHSVLHQAYSDGALSQMMTYE
jgi:hypothetical protein